MSENLFSGFDTVDKDEWLSKIEKDAKGKPIEEFEWQINAKFSQSPFVRKDDITESYNSISRNRKQNNWWITETIRLSIPNETNKAIISALEQGASSLELVFDRDLMQQEFSEIFKAVNFTYINSVFVVNDVAKAENIIADLIEFCVNNGQETSEINGGIRIKHQLDFNSIGLINKFQKLLPKFSFAYASCDNLFGYKETIIHELGSLFSRLTSILDSEIQYGFIDLNVNIGKSYFLNIAKLRAIHLIVKNLMKIYSQSGEASHNISSDENHNLIQFTSQAMSAVIGGVDSLRIPASDDFGLNQGSTFRKRLSRNTQSLMQMESFMANVLDPSAGSYYIESLTEQISEQAWAYLQNHS